MPQLKDVKVGDPFYLDPDSIGICREVLVKDPGDGLSATVFRIGGIRNGNLVLDPTGRKKDFKDARQSVILFEIG